jgi:EAL domain-containing protein (putative c-di-GMP-specific phosphodiesterase class I)
VQFNYESRGYSPVLNGTKKSGRSLGLVKSILSLSENMAIRIIAEGVEEAEEAALLSSLNCDIAQGYFFSRPVAEEFLYPMLEQRNPR